MMGDVVMTSNADGNHSDGTQIMFKDDVIKYSFISFTEGNEKEFPQIQKLLDVDIQQNVQYILLVVLGYFNTKSVHIMPLRETCYYINFDVLLKNCHWMALKDNPTQSHGIL